MKISHAHVPISIFSRFMWLTVVTIIVIAFMVLCCSCFAGYIHIFEGLTLILRGRLDSRIQVFVPRHTSTSHHLQ